MPIFLYLKLAGLAAAVAGAGYIAWSIRGSYAEHEREAAVSEAVQGIKEELAKEAILREHYEKLSDEKLAKLLKSISDVRAAQQTISAGIKVEREKNPDFYDQALPPGGYEEWMRAKALVSSAPASAASASPYSLAASQPRLR